MQSDVKWVGRQELVDRAIRAFGSRCNLEGVSFSQPSSASEVVELTNTGKRYVVLRNCRGTLAIYGVSQTTAGDRLRWLSESEWPAVLMN